MPVIQGFATPLLQQTDIAVNDSRAVLRASNATIEANEQTFRSVHLALRKSSDAIAAAGTRSRSKPVGIQRGNDVGSDRVS